MIRIATNQEDFFKLIQLRIEVFVLEQQVPILDEIDINDQTATHFIFEENNQVLATARIVIIDDTILIGRVCVSLNHRNQHLGKQLMIYIQNHVKNLGYDNVYLSAQLSALDFYKSLGYIPYGPVYLDAGIKHQMARLSLSS